MIRYSISFGLIALLTACGQPTEKDQFDGQRAALDEKARNLIRLAHSVERGGNIEAAIGMYKQIAMRPGDAVEGHLALSRVYMAQGDEEMALAMLREAKGRQPNHAEVNLRLGKYDIRKARPESALGFFEAGLRDMPDSIDLLNGKGMALDMMGQHPEAQAMYLTALKQGSKDKEFISNNLALSLIMDGEYKRAISVLEGIDGMGEVPVMRQNLALAYGLHGNMDKAREWGLKDLTETEIQDNIEFYLEYSATLETEQAVPSPEVSVSPAAELVPEDEAMEGITVEEQRV